MAVQLTPEQEQRIQAMVTAGAYPSVREALDAAVTAVEIFAAPAFEGPQEELPGLLQKGMASAELSAEEFWESVDHETEPPGSRHSIQGGRQEDGQGHSRTTSRGAAISCIQPATPESALLACSRL
jgi:Arc/MetJ-type ribon-helix-helix transcriptional regulator